MRVLVTGGAGYVGRFVVRELVARGHEVTAAGRRPDQVVDGAGYQVLDTTDYEAVVQALAGFDAVAHLAALPVPKPGLDVALFDANVRGTFHIFEACATHGIGTVAVASSINALGNKFGVRRIPVHYLPVDEAHPPLTTDSYSFSKQLTERIAQYAWDRHQIRSVSLRFPGVIDPVERPGTRFRQVLAQQHYEAMAPDFFCLVDARDVATAFALGLEADYDGAQPLFINDAANCFGLPTRDLVAQYYPTVTQFRAPLAGDDALITCERARQLLGWAPQWSTKWVLSGD